MLGHWSSLYDLLYLTAAKVFLCNGENWSGDCQNVDFPLGTCTELPPTWQFTLGSAGPDPGAICSIFAQGYVFCYMFLPFLQDTFERGMQRITAANTSMTAILIVLELAYSVAFQLLAMQTSTILRLVILGDKHCTCSAMSALRAPKNIQIGQFIVLVSCIVTRRYSSQLVQVQLYRYIYYVITSNWVVKQKRQIYNISLVRFYFVLEL